ncbi:HNH endonuclease [Roseivirga sp. BDSF3-8]|uniref:HNH endonuclease n=1 Tax=Roseivirga sp. BDSF3-8 TaxID=3241598 RepID=UPI003531B728
MLGYFSLDIFADGAGLVYSLARGDLPQAGGYAVGLYAIGPESVAASKATATALVLLIVKKEGVEVVEQQAGKRLLLQLAEKHVESGAISREAFAELQSLEERELAAALKAALNGRRLPGELPFLSQLHEEALSTVSRWDEAVYLKLEDDLASNPAFAEKFFDLANTDPGVVEAWKYLGDIGHNARYNTDLLKKISDLNSDQRLKVKSYYENMAHPQTFKGMIEYTATKTVGGKSISLQYDTYGFPKFDEFTPGSNTYVKSDNLTGNYEYDNAIANKDLITKLGAENVWVNPAGNGSPVSIKVNDKWVEFTWHHHQDGKTMIPVRKEVHSAFSHSGGKQAIESDLKGFFEY